MMQQPLLRQGVRPAETEAADHVQCFGRVRKQTALSALVAVMLVALIGRSVLETVAPGWTSQHFAPTLLHGHWRDAAGKLPGTSHKGPITQAWHQQSSEQYYQ